MLFQLRTKTNALDPLTPVTLADIDLKEIDLQKLLFDNLHRVVREEELLPIAQSRAWQEEPDIIAIDKTGAIYLFELKAWESRSENLLQVMRYTQKFSTYDYDRLSTLFRRSKSEDLSSFHRDHFELDSPLNVEKWNHKQILVVMTNGLDYETREATRYWKTQGVDIRPWIYRIYQVGTRRFLSFEAFGAEDDPYEDRQSRFHIVNTNYSNRPEHHEYMMDSHRAAAFNDPWKYYIKYIANNDIVFLYQSRVGLVAYGRAKSQFRIKARGDDEEYYVDLVDFKPIDPPISASELRELAGYKVPLLRTYTSISTDAGKSIAEVLKSRRAKSRRATKR